jgi:divalent metal cation (Fe/Co/Zn/Cd) transporter
MTQSVEQQTSKGQKTLLTALLLSAPGPLVTGISVFLSLSTTQFADFLRRTTELVALFASWWIYRKLQRNKDMEQAQVSRLEHLANLYVGGSMGVSGVILFIVALIQISADRAAGNVTMGLIIAILGLITNTWFWFRYRSLTREKYDAILSAQQSLYRAKASVDFCVVTALMAVAIAPTHPVTKAIDIIGSVIVACYLLWNGIKTIRGSKTRFDSLNAN